MQQILILQLCSMTYQIMNESFNHEKKISYALILFIVATDIFCSERKASNVSGKGQLKIEQSDIEFLRAPKNLSKSTLIQGNKP